MKSSASCADVEHARSTDHDGVIENITVCANACSQAWPVLTATSALVAGTKACITLGSITYDEFADMPFLDCNGEDVMTAVFIHTDGPYVYDLRDRRTRPCTPPLELENALAVSPLELPPSIILD